MKTIDKMASKTILINFSPDLSEQTTELMTLFFTYQTYHEKIDILDLSGKINPTLQQGCDITGGRYFSSTKYPKSLLGCIAVGRSILLLIRFLFFREISQFLTRIYHYFQRYQNRKLIIVILVDVIKNWLIWDIFVHHVCQCIVGQRSNVMDAGM